MASTPYFCWQKRAVKRKTDKGFIKPIKKNYKQKNNRIMGYFIITDSNWAKLRNEILSLAETCQKAFGEQSRHTDWLHTVMCAGCSTSASAPCCTTVIRACCPLSKSDISAITSVRMWSSCSKPNRINQKWKNKINT